MSSTSRGGAIRDADDHYQTPAWVVRLMLHDLYEGDSAPTKPIDKLDILEPEAGRGSMVKVMLAAGADPKRIIAVERDAGRCAILRTILPPENVYNQDFLTCGADFAGPAPVGGVMRAFDVVLMNPPFAPAEKHVRHATHFLNDTGICMALLRLAWLLPKKRRAFRKAYPCSVLALERRPSFTAESLEWLTEAELLAMAKPLKATKTKPARLETVGQVRARLKGSDSADYAILRFGHGCGGRYAVLEGRGE